MKQTLSGIIFTFITIISLGQSNVKLVGVEFGMKGNAIIVTGKYVGAPATEAPLYYGDTLVAINGKPVKNMKLDDAFALMHDQTKDTVVLRMQNNGMQDDIAIEMLTVKQITLRRASIIKNVLMKDLSLPPNIPNFTNWGYVFDRGKNPVYCDDVEYLKGGLIKRTTKRNRENVSATEVYTEKVFDILRADLTRLYPNFSFTAFEYMGSAPDGTYYYAGKKSFTTGSGGDEWFIFNNKGEDVFALGGLHYRNNYNGITPARIEYVGQHVFALQQNIKPFKWALYDKDRNPLTGPEFDEVESWTGPGAYVKKGKNWKIVAFENLPVTGNGPWSFMDKSSGLYGFANRKGKIVVKPRFDNAHDFVDGIAAVKMGSWGFMNENMKWVIEPEYTDIFGFNEQQSAPVQLQGSGNWIYIDRTGKQSVPGEFNKAYPFQYNNKYAHVVKKDNTTAIIDNLGNTILGFMETTKDLYVQSVAPGLFSIKAKGIVYFKDIYETPYLHYDYAKGRLQNPDDIRIASQRDAGNRQKENDAYQRRVSQQKTWEQQHTESAIEIAKSPQQESKFIICSECNGSGYKTVIGSSTINGRKYIAPKIHYVDAYGIASRNYFTMNCSKCRGKGTINR